jgi:hypothetical protein
MFAVRSAILVLAIGYFSSPVAASVSFRGSSPARDAIVAASHVDPSDSTLVVVSLPGPSAFSRMARRTSRLKAALEESRHDFEEADLGRVYLPKGHSPPPSTRFASPSIPTTCRLRC